MPYFRRYKPRAPRRRTYRRRRRNIFWRRGYNKLARMARFWNVEFKKHQVTLADTAITNAGVVTQCSNIAVGTGYAERIGHSIKVTSLYARGTISKHASATATSVRIMLVMDAQTNQAVFAVTDLLESAGIHTYRNIDNTSRFKVLADKKLIVDSTTPKKFFSIFKKINQHVRFDASTSAIADITQASFAIVMIGSEATNEPTVYMNFRLRFVDN